METIFEASMAPSYRTTDYNTAEEAVAAVMKAGDGKVVKFLMERNLPNCLPEWVARSLATWVYEEGQWYMLYIFSGDGGRERCTITDIN
jgi:hypothetical protein